MLSGIGINDELVPHLEWLLAKNDLEALFPSFPIVDTLTLPLIEIGDEKEADLGRLFSSSRNRLKCYLRIPHDLTCHFYNALLAFTWTCV